MSLRKKTVKERPGRFITDIDYMVNKHFFLSIPLGQNSTAPRCRDAGNPVHDCDK